MPIINCLKYLRILLKKQVLYSNAYKKEEEENVFSIIIRIIVVKKL